MKHWRSAFAAGLIAVAAVGSASAGPVPLTYLGLGPGVGVVNVNYVDVNPIEPKSSSSYTGALRMTGGEAIGLADEFLAFCLDLTYQAGAQGKAFPYEVTSTPFTGRVNLSENIYSSLYSGLTREAAIGKLFDSVYSGEAAGQPAFSLTNGSQVAAFQMALWELAYERSTDQVGVDTGDFTANNGVNWSNSRSTLANSFLAFALGYDGPARFNPLFLQSTNNPLKQNLVAVSPIPLPAAGLLLLGGLAALATVRRRETPKA